MKNPLAKKQSDVATESIEIIAVQEQTLYAMKAKKGHA